MLRLEYHLILLKEKPRFLFNLPQDYEVVIGNGGATAFWDAAIFGLIKENAQFLSFGEFSNKFATAAQNAPFLKNVEVIKSEPGDAPDYQPNESFDVYATAHNETSTGVMKEVKRPSPRTKCDGAFHCQQRWPAWCS